LSPERSTPTSAPPPNPEGPSPADGTTIFLLDEDDAVRDALAMSLRAAGHAVAAFGSARQFIDGYRRGDPGCLVVDMDLPEGGAAGLLRTLAVAQVILPAIITIRRLRRNTPVGGLPAGRILFLEKPFGVDELLRLIRLALGNCGSQSGRLTPPIGDIP
jgi:two-component system, LuxR family, response regulator FixJ